MGTVESTTANQFLIKMRAQDIRIGPYLDEDLDEDEQEESKAKFNKIKGALVKVFSDLGTD